MCIPKVHILKYYTQGRGEDGKDSDGSDEGRIWRWGVCLQWICNGNGSVRYGYDCKDRSAAGNGNGEVGGNRGDSGENRYRSWSW